MHGLVVDLEVPYFACFRKPTSTSVMLTFPIPPLSTTLGLIANALGVPRQRYFEELIRLQNDLRMNLSPLQPLERPTRELAKILKLVGEEWEERKPTSFPSSPMHKYLMVRPAYRLYIASENPSLLAEVAEAFNTPARPLYLGQSDDMVAMNTVWQGEVVEQEVEQVFGLLRGIHDGCELVRLPFGFQNERTLLYLPPLSLPKAFPFPVSPRRVFMFSDEGVELFGIQDTARQEEERAG